MQRPVDRGWRRTSAQTQLCLAALDVNVLSDKLRCPSTARDVLDNRLPMGFHRDRRREYAPPEDERAGREEAGMPEQRRPKVILRGRDEGDTMILPMGGLQAHITRKASRTETGGHWALGEAWQDPGFDNPPHTHDEAEAFYVLEGSYTFYTEAAPAEGVSPGTFVFIPPGAVHGFRAGPQGGRLLCVWPSSVENSLFDPGRREADAE